MQMSLREQVVQCARQFEADIVCFGHSHIPETEFSHGRLLLNPGSIAEPRQNGRKHTYAILTVEKNKIPRADIHVITPGE